MENRYREVGTQLTVDHLLARLNHLERAFAALQQAYVDLQATAREERRASLAEGVLPHRPTPEPALHVHEGIGAGPPPPA